MSAIQSASEGSETARCSGAATWLERRWVVVAVYLALSGIALYPLLSVTIPPLVDYPNHLARMYILAHWDTDPALQLNYVPDWKLLPNMAMELFVPFLARFMSIYTAGKIFVAAAMLSVLAGTLVLRKVLVGKVGLWPVLTFLLLFNQNLFWGFLNYLFTAGLALLALAAWIALRERPWVLKAAIFSIVTVVLYACHLFGLFAYGLLVFGYEIWRSRRAPAPMWRHLRQWSETALQFIVPAVLFLLWTIDNASVDGAMTDFGSPADRLFALASLTSFDTLYLDLPTLLFLAFLWPTFRSDKNVGIAQSMKIPLILVTAVALLMPSYLSGVWGTHMRLPLILACVLIAATRFASSDWRPMPYVVGAAIALFVARTAAIAEDWRDVDGKFLEFRQAIAAIEPGSRLLPIGDVEHVADGRSYLDNMQFSHMLSLAVIERSAFQPILFTGFTTVGVTDRVRDIDTPVGAPVPVDLLLENSDPATSVFRLGRRFERYIWAYWTGWPTRFDYAVSLRFSDRTNPSPAHLQRIAERSFFDIYRVVPGPP